MNKERRAMAYQELQDREVRLLRVQRVTADTATEIPEIVAELAVFSLDQDPDYVALSYCWRTAQATEAITLNVNTFMVRPNVMDDLRLIAVEAQTSWTSWTFVDAICMYQDDVREKGHQVRQMGDVYRKAAEVVAWLGVPPPGASFAWEANVQTDFDRVEAALASLRADLGLPDWDFSRHRQETDRLLSALDLAEAVYLTIAEMFRAAHWLRLWVAQETMLAAKLTVRCAHIRVDWVVLLEIWLFHEVRVRRGDTLEYAALERSFPSLGMEQFLKGDLGGYFRGPMVLLQRRASHGLIFGLLGMTDSTRRCTTVRRNLSA
jgi:hypothetical protein